jgi:hypothetical protein
VGGIVRGNQARVRDAAGSSGPVDAAGARTRRTIVVLLLAGVAVQLSGLAVAAFGPGLRGTQAEDLVPFTYLLATIATVLAAVIAMAGSVLILSLTLGTSVQRSHLGSMILGDEDFRIAVSGAIVTILAACLALLAAHLPAVSHSPFAIFLLSLGGVAEFGVDAVALARLFRRIPRLLTQEMLLETALARVDAAYLVAQEERLLGPEANESTRLEVLNDLIFSFRVYPVEADDPLVTVHDVLESVLAQSPASVAATSLALASRRFAALAEPSHDQIYQLLVTPWLAELRVAIVRRGSPSIGLAFFDLWADVLVASRTKGLARFYAHAARPFVTAMRDVARAGVFEGAGGRLLRPLVRTMSAGGGDPASVGPWAGALIVWMREDAERGDGTWTRLLWNPVENVLELYLDDLSREIPLLDVLVHGLTGVLRASARSGIETGDGRSFALKLALRARRAQLDLEARLDAAPEAEGDRVRRRIALLEDPVAAAIALAATYPALADAPRLLRAADLAEDDRDGEA